MLAYADIIATPIETGAICARFSIEQVTFIAFLLAGMSPADWVDYEQYRDEIDALVAATQDAATTPSVDCSQGGGMIPVGMVAIMATGSVATGWLECNGNEYAQADYPGLYAAIGLSFGVAGVGMFRVPDLRAKFPMGWSTDGVSPNRPIGESVGSNVHTLSVGEIPSHRHISQYQATGTTGVQPSVGVGVDINQPYHPFPPGYAGTMVTDATGGGQAHNNIPASVTFAYHIYAGGGDE